ncbi:Undecaprenyl-diphosphatase [hydrothermal vent metagenome]|uniref:Undecaprenyl-diphosphatase n=1 Tax=hydrothermal vent metagenome TaxID=652676 RepID=A0A3B0ZYH4_9ZZZZ
MTLIQIITLALVQGFTEFLPISSSAHLILVPIATGWQDQGLAFDIAVHVGTLSAVMLYFKKEVTAMAVDWSASCIKRKRVGESRLAWAVIFGTIPVMIAGLLFSDIIDSTLRSPMVIAYTTIGFGALLWLADVKGSRQRDEHSLSWRDILIIGLAQALALIPGTSRSGITMTAALLLGLSRSAAARFSFLLSIPAILASGSYKSLQLIQGDHAVNWGEIFLGIFLSGLVAYACIHVFLAFLERVGMMPFVIYRFVLGIVLIAIFV